MSFKPAISSLTPCPFVDVRLTTNKHYSQTVQLQITNTMQQKWHQIQIDSILQEIVWNITNWRHPLMLQVKNLESIKPYEV